MITRKSLFVVAAMILFVVGLSACAPGESVMAPDVEISMDDAVAGQASFMEGWAAGSVSLSDTEASSLITELMKQNGLNALHIDSIDASMDGNVNNISVNLGQSIAGIDSVGIEGSLMSDGGILSVDIHGVHAGAMGVMPEILGMVSEQINAQLAGIPAGLPDGAYALTPEMAGQVMGMLQQMGLDSAEVAAVKTGFDGGNVHLVAELASPVMGVDSLGVDAAVSAGDGMMNVGLNNLSAGNLVVDGGILGLINDQISANLGSIPMLPLSVEAGDGSLMIGMMQ
ncbi:MAG: hypothetical protein AAF702_51215 [Chloroflexota bacterium]